MTCTIAAVPHCDMRYCLVTAVDCCFHPDRIARRLLCNPRWVRSTAVWAHRTITMVGKHSNGWMTRALHTDCIHNGVTCQLVMCAVLCLLIV